MTAVLRSRQESRTTQHDLIYYDILLAFSSLSFAIQRMSTLRLVLPFPSFHPA